MVTRTQQSIAVTTPTGHVGSHVTRLLVQAGVRPILLLRDPSKLPPGVADHAEISRGDLTDADFVRSATADVSTLFWLDTTSHFADDPIAESARSGEIVAGAVRENEISRVVFLSSVGAEKRHGAGHLDGLARIEEALDSTGCDIIHLRCGYFFTNLMNDLDSLRAGRLVTATPPDLPFPWVDPRDIADIVTARLLSTSWSGRHVQAVHGPADLTFTEVVKILTDAVGQKISVHSVTNDDIREVLRSFGAGPKAVEGIVGMSSTISPDFTPEQRRDVLTTTPTTLGEWAYAELRPLLRSSSRFG